MIIVQVYIEHTPYGRIKGKVLNADFPMPVQTVDSIPELEQRIKNWYWQMQRISGADLEFDYDLDKNIR